MTRSTRVFVAIACVTALVVIGGTAALAAAVYRAGFLEVQVAGAGDDLSLRVPGIVVPVAVRLVPAEALGDAAKKIAPFLPALRATFEELARCEDAVFVEADRRGDHVRIGKRDGVFYLDVRSEGGTVHVSLPLHAVEPILTRLESAVRQAV
jgi:hypothetical protein